MSKSSKSLTPVAEICLYGTSAIGAGYIVSIPTAFGRTLRVGTGTPAAGRSFTEAVWLALDVIRLAGHDRGIVHVYEPTGQRFAEIDLAKPAGWFGDLKWKTGGTVYVVSTADLAAAAQ